MSKLNFTELEIAHGTYSDLHKDARHSVADWTLADFEAVFEQLSKVCAENAAADKIAEEESIAEFEERLQTIISMGATSRERAILWVADSENVDGDMEYLCYKLGLPYGYFTKDEAVLEKIENL